MASPAPDDICHAFLAAQGGPAPASGDLPVVLGDVLAAVAAAWPGLRSDPAGFAAFLGRRVPPDVEVGRALSGRAVDELYLVFACLAGDPAALEVLDARYLQPLVGLLVKQGSAPDLARDTVQALRVRMLAGERPQLHQYGGAGSLKGWLRVSALRASIRAHRGLRPADEVTDALADAAASPVVQYQRRLYGDEFRAAFEHAVASLSVRERNLLKQSVLYGATVDEIGALYHVHRATAARWIAAARERLAEETRQRMIAQLRIEPAEYDSILELIHSQLDVSVSRVLGA